MRPLRMCMVCRERKEKQELVRVVCAKGDVPRLDLKGKSEGRGMYLCKSADCVKQAERRRVIERAFSCRVEKSVYEELLRLVGEKE